MRGKPLLIAIALQLAALVGQAQAGCVMSKVAELPVKMVGLSPIVSVKINGMEASFLLDTGAAFSIVPPDTVVKFGLTKAEAPPGLVLRGAGGRSVDVSIALAKHFRIADSEFHKTEFFVSAQGIGGRADGLLGQNFLGVADVEYDLANGVVRMFVPKGCETTRLAYWVTTQPYSVIDIWPVSSADPAPVGSAAVNGTGIRVVFDTGSPVSILTASAAERAGVKLGGPGVSTDGYIVGLSPTSTAASWTGPFDSFKLGDEEIQHTRLRFADSPLAANAQMMLGADFFLSHRVFISNSQRKLYFTYNGGPVFNLERQPDPAAPGQQAAVPTPDAAYSDAPTDAAGFSARASGLAARNDYSHALADMDKAVALAPNEPRYLRERSRIELAANQREKALADIASALKIKPDDVDALMDRADLHLLQNDKTAARQDLDVVDHLAVEDADVRLRLGSYYLAAGAFDLGVAQFDRWIAAHPKSDEMAVALNNRCWLRAQWGRDLDKAQADCDAALKLKPGDPKYRDSRGMVELRLGQFDKSIADYRAALALMPDNPWSLYGRGLAELKMGRKAEGDADLKAAAARQADIADQAKALGLTP